MRERRRIADASSAAGMGRPGTSGTFATLLVGVALWLGACAGDPAQNPAWTLAGHPGLLYWVKFYYERNAREENGRCSAPLLEGVSRAEVLSEDRDQLVIRLDYRYRDVVRDEPRAPSGALPFFRECEGFASRTFTIAKRADGLVVTGMDGPQRQRPAPPAAAPQ
jgi:hypothetical protein